MAREKTSNRVTNLFSLPFLKSKITIGSEVNSKICAVGMIGIGV
jgi:hypothetical protein